MTRNTRRVVSALGGIGLAVAAALALAGCGPLPAQPQEVVPSAPAAAVRVETILVAREDWKRVSEAMPAELLPYEKTDLHAKVAGYLHEIRVDYGDRVTKGDVLALLWVPELEKQGEHSQAQVRRAEAAILQAQEAFKVAAASIRSAAAGVAEAEAGRTRARAQYERWQTQYAHAEDLVRRHVLDAQTREETLHQLKVAQAAVEEVEAKVTAAQAARDVSQAMQDKAQADVGEAEAQLQVAKANRAQTEVLLQYARIVAPYDGVVTRRNLHTGAFLHAKGSEPPLLTVMRTEKLRLVVDVPEKDVPYLDKDDYVHVALDALPGKPFTCKISRLAPVLGAGKKVRVEADLPNPEGLLYPGMYGHAAVILEDKPEALTLPATCVGSDDKGSYVLCVVDGKVQHRTVTIGLNDGKKVEILSGLRDQEEILASGKQLLREGQPVLAQRSPVATKR